MQSRRITIFYEFIIFKIPAESVFLTPRAFGGGMDEPMMRHRDG